MDKKTIDQFFDSLSEDVLKEKWDKYDKYSKQKNSVMIKQHNEHHVARLRRVLLKYKELEDQMAKDSLNYLAKNNDEGRMVADCKRTAYGRIVHDLDYILREYENVDYI